MTTLSGMQVVVIGGSSGIGLGTAEAALADGARVVITGRSPARLADAKRTLLAKGSNQKIEAVELDSADESGTEALFKRLGVVDHIFVSAATVGQHSGFASDTALARPSMDTRFWGSVFAAKYGSKNMPKHGSITFCSGVGAMRPRRGGSVGAASAGAVEALARSLAFELAPIRVNTVVPGLIDTPLLSSAFGPNKDKFLEQAAKQLPAGRIGRVEDIADAVLFLMKNTYVTGIALTVDGGRLLV